MEKYFISKGHFYQFSLKELDGEQRMRMLGISLPMFGNSKKVNQWYDNIKGALESESLLDQDSLDILNQLKMEML